MVSAAQFQAMQQPSRRTSKLKPFDKDLRVLRSKGYTLSQMQEFLAANQVTVTAAAISAYLIKSNAAA